VIIAHRLSTVEIADRVIVLSDGRIVEDGPPGRLLTADGEYSALHADWRASLA
jgi:ATP-binding cassette subfamily B protein